MADSDFKKLMGILEDLKSKSDKSSPTVVDLTSLPEGLAEFITHLHSHLDEIHTKVDDLTTSNQMMVKELTQLKEGSNALAKLFMQYAEKINKSNEPKPQDNVKESKGRGKRIGVSERISG